MTSQANNRNGGMLITRNERSMPKWVSEQSDRIGPRPPPPPSTPENGQVLIKEPILPPKTKQPEPDYEVIEFSNQQYSNAPIRPNSASSGSKTPDNKLKCTLCGSGNPWVTCEECAQQIFCASCDDMFHKHPKRKNHQRKTIEKSRPPLPPKVLPGQSGPTPPVAPPRRNKRGLMTPIMQRKDQGNAMPGPFPVPSSPTPSMKNSSWQERFGSLPRGLNLLNRPLPETPKTPSESSRSTTPKSVFDNIQRPPSVALEKIKSKANATLDRMQLLQQRYRQQKEQMERERSGSVTDQNLSAFDQWSSISQSPSHFRSGSMSSGINSSHLDLTDDNNFNLFHQRQMAFQHHQIAAQRANQLGQRGMSSSVFNLSHMNRKQPTSNNGWMNNHLQQAQSVAQLNCSNCAQHQPQWNGTAQHHMHMPQDPWSNQLTSQQHLNRSNMSLNVSAGYMMQPQMNGMYPPPTFMNQRNLMQQMYPQPYIGGMPIMNPGLMAMPPSTSRAGSRMASPAMSRKSVTLRRKQRSCYIDDEATDDEDSDEDDRRSITSARSGVSRSRQRRMSSASQIQPVDDIDSSQVKLNRNRARNQRRDSVAKSVHNDWAPGRRTSSSNNNRSADSGFNSPLKPSRIYSDLDSEGSGTRALVQAKIEQKLKEESLKQKQSKPKRQSQSPTPQKTSSAVQTPPVKHSSKSEKVENPIEEFSKQPKAPSESEAENVVQQNKKEESKAFEEKQATKEEEEDGENSESESEQSHDSESVNENEQTQQIEENEIEEDDLGPPPSTPDHEWECEFCTFVNEANIKICTICCKTPSIQPKKILKSISPPKQTKITTIEKDKETTKENKPVKIKTGTIKKKPLTSSSQPSTIQNTITHNTESLQTTKTDSAHNTEDRIESAANTLKNKESVEDIWAALDENIQNTAHEVSRKAEAKNPAKISTACGNFSGSASVELRDNDSRQSQAREIGTSPPPQSISTQTYDTLPPPKSEIRKETVVKPPSQPIYNDIIQHTNFPSSPKIQDLKSFEAEVLNNIHNISHVPSHCHNHHAKHHPMYSHNDRQRYRSNNDLRMDDTMSMDFEAFNGLGRRQPSISELMLLQKTSSQMHSPFGGSIYDLPYRELSSVRPNDMENHKESDIYKHTTEELNAALKYCGPDMHPLVWLRDNWPKLIQTVQSLATKYGQERAENTIGTISQMEAREALRMHTGNIWQAVSECIEQRQRKYREIFAKGNFSREDIVTALTTHQGNDELALMDLGRSQLKPFLMRIWGSPGGVENESGSLPSPATTHSSQSTHYNMNKDIHNFLSANASECMQKPNSNGAFSLNNQMPSPFDRPVSLNSPFDSNYHMLDNTSSNSADSKDFANSPNSLPLGESVHSNKNVLKDLETLIGNIEHNQQNQKEQVIRSVNDMNINLKPKPENEYDSESMRILTKSPISSPKLKITPKESNLKNEADVKNFVWQHIQEIVPNLVHQVEMELMDDIEQKLKNNEGLEEKRETTPELKQIAPPPPPPPIDQDEFLMEEVIKPNIRNALIREELPPHYVYTAEIATFQMTFDRGLERIHVEEFELETLEDASKQVYKMFKAPEVQMVQEDENITNQIIETTHEVKIDLTDAPVQTLISPIPQTDSSNAEVPISLLAQLEVLQTQLQEAISSEPQFDSTKAEVHVTFGAQSDLMQSEIKKANLSDFQHGSSNIELSAFLHTQSEVQINREIPTTSKNNIELEGIKTENVQTLDEVNIDKDVMKTITFETPNESLEYNKEIQPSTNNSLQVSSETKVEKLTDKFSESSVITIRLGETNTQTAYDEIPSSTQWEYNIKKENFSEVHTNTKATNDEILNQKHQQTNVEPSVVRTSSINTIPETTSTNEPAKTFRESPVEKEENANLSPQINKPNKESKIQTKSMNLQKRTTVKDLEQAKAEAKVKNVGNHDEIVPIASDNDFKKPEVVSKAYNSPKNQMQPDESNKNMNNISVQITENTPSTSQTSTTSNKPFSTLETNVTSNESLPSILNRISKIPVRRTFSNKSLINNSSTLTKTRLNKDLKSPDFNLPITTREIEIPKSRFEVESPNSLFTEDESEEELNGIESESSTTNVTSRAEQLQSPSTASEMFLVIQQEGSENTSTVAPSTSSSTLHSTISQSSGLKSPTEFIPSGDPSKQNLTELVEDTQRLIKQMKDEISIDDFESSTDDDDYSEEYSDEYDDGEDEEEEEEWEEEEEENEDDEEYDDLTEEITEENELFSVEGDSLSQPQSPPPSQETQDSGEIRNSSALSNITEFSDHSQALLSDHFEQDELTTKKSNDTHNELYSFEGDSLSKPQSPPPSQESQDPREIHNSSALSNITESSDHSQALLSDHFEQDELTTKKSNVTHNKNDNVEDTAAFVETENSLPDLPVETLLENNFDNSQSFMQLVELPKSLPETSVETVLSSVKIQDHSNAQNYSKDETALVSGLKDILSARISISNELESENSIPELPVEIVYTNSATQQATDDSTLKNNKDLEDVDKLEDSQKSIKISQTENDLPTFSKKQLPTGPKEPMKDANQPPTSKQNATIDPSKKIKESINQSQVETESLNSNVETDSTNVSANDSLTTKEDLPTTSTSKKLSLTSVQNTQQSKYESNAANVTSSSKGTKSLENNKKSNNETKNPVKKSPAASKIPKPKETPKEPKPKVTPITKPQNEFKKKLYTRSKSFSGPPTPIGIASVKTISQKFISPNPNTKQLTTPKSYSTVPRKSSIVEAINKLNKPLTSTENPAISAIFKSRTQPRIPKKKYHETCFSDDDYESSTSEEEIETLEVRQRKLSVPVFRAYPSVQEPEEVTTEDLVQKFMREELTTTIAEAQIAAALVSMKFQQDVSIWAAKECSDLDHAIALLKQECELCSGTYALNQIVSMLKCTHKCCKQCVKTYFTVQITERSINDCCCPFCKLPELHNQTEHEDDYLEYFSNLDIFLKNILEPDVHELFQRKLRDRTLLKDPNFKWCVQCSSGFFARPKQKRLICPDCGSVTCAQCRKTWKKQHEGISCDQYSEWESANDPEVQAKGVKQHLEQNGIDCPKCKFRYSLTRGGCMHFTCTQCKYEFCYGCAKPFMMGAKCTISPYCAKLGLHAHHPRNCLFYLRDKLPVQLQILLKNNNESFEVDPIEVPDSENDNEPSSSKKKEQLCPIPIQKETPTGLIDTKCNGDVPEKHAGMCRTHYVEYLTAKVAKAKIDPLPIFDLTDCVQELRRRGIALPERGPWDTDEIYKNMCTEVIQKNIPLDIMD